MDNLSPNQSSDFQTGFTALPAGVAGQYAYFSGEQDKDAYEYIRISDDSVLKELQGEGTISAWLFRDVEEQDNDWRNVYDIPNSHLLEFSPSGGFDWRAENGHQDFFNVNGPKLGSNEWTHVAVTMSEEDGGGYVPAIYVNGDLTDESTNWQIGEQGNDNGLKTTTDDLYLGILWSQKRNNPDPWKGGIDEFKVWKSSLSELEIKDVVAGGNDVRNDDLLLHLDFESVHADHVFDVSGNKAASPVKAEIHGDVNFLGEAVVEESKIIARGDSAYVVVEGPTWEEAEANSNALGGHLVTINDADENEFLYGSYLQDYQSLWIGLTDKKSEGEWLTPKGSSASYTNWSEGEPNNSGSTDTLLNLEEDYAHIKLFDSGKWNDLFDNHKQLGNYQTAAGIAEIPLIRREDSAYVLVEGPTWKEAEANANTLGGHLVTINNQEENDWLVENFMDVDLVKDDDRYINHADIYSIGLTRDGADKPWRWASGEDVSFTNFGPKEPFNGQKYAAMNTFNEEQTDAAPDWNWGSVSGSWVDGMADGVSPMTSDGLYGIAEIPLSAIRFASDVVLPPVDIDKDLLSLDAVMVSRDGGVGVNQISILGGRHDTSGDYRIDITAELLSKVHNLEAVEVTIKLDPMLFESINLSDVQISSQLPIQNSIRIDNEAGTVTLSGASLSNLGQGSMINGDQALASIDLNFDNDYLETIAYNDVTGELELSPISFQMCVGEEEAIFSRDFTDATGQLNRDIQSLAELNGGVALNSDRVSLIKEIVRMEEESGLTLGTQRTIGVKGEFTNLVREGATLEATTEWRNTGNTTVDGLQVEAIENANARLVNAQFSEGKQTLGSGRFVDGEWVAEAAESTEITAKVEVTGKAGHVLDLSEGILGVSTETSKEVFENEEGSKNLITYQGDLNYDGRVSFKDLAYLNAGAARQELVDKVDASGKEVTNEFGSVEQVATEESYASDVDANYDGKVSIADLSVLEKDWGKSLHTGDESFLGSGESLTWESIDGDGTWDNSSFKRENAVAAKQIAEAQEAAGAISEAVDEGAGGGLNDGPSEVQEDDGLIGSEVY